jgi:hypothetical protein
MRKWVFGEKNGWEVLSEPGNTAEAEIRNTISKSVVVISTVLKIQNIYSQK